MITTFLHSFKSGQILPAVIVKQISAHQYLVKIDKYELTAYSPLRFESPHILVQIASLTPKMHLRIIDERLKLSPNLIGEISKKGLIVDEIVSLALKTFMQKYSPEKTVELAHKMFELANLIPDWHLIPFSYYIAAVFDIEKNADDLIASFGLTKKVKTERSKAFLTNAIEQFIESKLEPTSICFKKPYSMFNFNNMLITQEYNPVTDYAVKKCRFCFETDIENIFEIKQYKNKVAIAFTNYSGIALKMMKSYEEDIKTCLTEKNIELLPFSYIVTPKKSLYNSFIGV